jgi:tRNA (guanine37-N1)-methyltransferase
MLRIDFISLFPDMMLSSARHSMLLRAEQDGLVRFSAVDPREFSKDKHRTVDDKPYAGGPGMLMKVDVVIAALRAATGIGDRGTGIGGPGYGSASQELHSASSTPNPSFKGGEPGEALSTIDNPTFHEPGQALSTIDYPLSPNTAIIVPDPTGPMFTQSDAQELATKDQVIFICGHYEGMDHRIYKHATHVFSIGDYVLTGGELPALVIADSIIRLLPGVLGCQSSLEIDSHSDGLLSAPQYTRPDSFEGDDVPEVLKSGNHQAVETWKRREALRLTRDCRPDLFCKAKLAKKDLDLLSF